MLDWGSSSYRGSWLAVWDTQRANWGLLADTPVTNGGDRMITHTLSKSISEKNQTGEEMERPNMAQYWKKNVPLQVIPKTPEETQW